MLSELKDIYPTGSSVLIEMYCPAERSIIFVFADLGNFGQNLASCGSEPSLKEPEVEK